MFFKLETYMVASPKADSLSYKVNFQMQTRLIFLILSLSFSLCREGIREYLYQWVFMLCTIVVT